MSSNRPKKLLKSIFKANAGCSCGKAKLSDVIEPTPKPKIPIHQPMTHSSSSSSRIARIPSDYPDSSSSSSCQERNDGVSTTDDTVELSSSSTSHLLPSEDVLDNTGDHQPQKNKKIPRKNSISDSCIAVVKDSDDPFEDFKQSMKQMIVEKDIYAKKDLQELLRCFLELNSPSHKDVIVRAFTEIWNDVVSQKLLVVNSDQKLKKTGDHEYCFNCCARAKMAT